MHTRVVSAAAQSAREDPHRSATVIGGLRAASAPRVRARTHAAGAFAMPVDVERRRKTPHREVIEVYHVTARAPAVRSVPPRAYTALAGAHHQIRRAPPRLR